MTTVWHTQQVITRERQPTLAMAVPVVNHGDKLAEGVHEAFAK
jgi:hypothetical protein